MPELPEVETTIKGINIIKNLKINKVSIHTKKLRYLIPISLKKILKNNKIIKIERIAKYILLKLNNNFTLILHLGMSGRLKIQRYKLARGKHDHIVINFIDKYNLIFNDPRKFGFVDIVKTNNIKSKNYIANIGLDALSKKLNRSYLHQKIIKSDVVIKQILLNQHVVGGIGNIYASEILFDAKISPLLKGRELNISQIMRLIVSIRKILKKAIDLGGASIRDYRASDGTIGNFQNKFKVYNREGKKILNFKVKKIIQHGRATYYCPEIQNKKKEQIGN